MHPSRRSRFFCRVRQATVPDVLAQPLSGVRELNGGPTFAAITARSYHPGGVNALFGDGSVRFFKSSINGNTWRGLGTVAGSEVIGANDF